MTETSETEEKPAKTLNWRAIWYGLRAVGLILLLPILFGLIWAGMMFNRDVTAPSWVTEEVIERAEEALGGGTLEFGDFTMRIGKDLHPRVRLTNTELRDANGELIAQVDKIEGLMSPRGILFERAALVQEVQLSGAELTLNRAEDGSVALTFDQTESPFKSASNLPGLLSQLDAFFETPSLVALEQIEMNDLGLTYTDARADQTWRVTQGMADLNLRDQTTHARATFFIEQDTGADTEVSLDFFRPPSQDAELSLTVINARTSDIASQSPALSWLSALDAPVTASLQTGLSEDGSVLPVTVALDLGQGVLKPTSETPPLSFETAQALFEYDPSVETLEFSDVLVTSDWGGVDAKGQAILLDTSRGVPGSIVAQLDLSNVDISPPGYFDAPQRIEAATIDLRVQLDPFKIDIGQLTTHDSNVPLRASGYVSGDAAGWSVALDFNIPAADQASLQALWPNGMKPKARNWFAENLLAGVVSDLSGGIRIQPSAPMRYSIGFQYDDTVVQVTENLPAITGAAGYASFVEDAFNLSIAKGGMTAPTGGRLDFAGSQLHIPDLRVDQGPMDLNFDVDGSITAALSTLNLPPFQFMDKAKLPVTVADGRAAINGTITVPMKRRMTRDEVAVDIGAMLTRVNSEELVPNRQLTASSLDVSISDEALKIEGPAILSGVPLTATFVQEFVDGGQRRLDGTIELSQQFLDGFDIELPPGSLGGRGQGLIAISMPKEQPPEFELLSDLRGVSLAIPSIGWAKTRNTAGDLLVRGVFAEPARIDLLEIAGGGLSATGSVSLNENGGLSQARFQRVRLSNWLDAPITMRGRGNGRPVAVSIAGGALDLRRATFGGGSGQSGPLELNLDRLQITEGIALTGFTGSFDGTGGFSGQFQGRVNGQAQVRGTVVPQNGRSAVRLVSDQAGEAVAAAGFLRNATGGQLDLTLIPTGGEGTFDGTMKMTALRVRDAPAIAALLNAISVVGLLQQLDGQGLAFDEVDAKFRLTPDQVIVTQSSAVGPGLGLSLDGIYTLASKRMDFQGVVSPIYLINGIGSVLTRKGEGLIGFNFNISGTDSQPNVVVNPLSALTPGMFREIFRRPAPQVGQ